MALFDWLSKPDETAQAPNAEADADETACRCLFCGYEADCREAETGWDVAPSYCPNAAFFAAHGGRCHNV